MSISNNYNREQIFIQNYQRTSSANSANSAGNAGSISGAGSNSSFGITVTGEANGNFQETTTETNNMGVNGVIDEPVKQGGTGDCWLIAAITALASTPIGREFISDAIKVNSDGSVSVTFAAYDVTYVITPEEIKKRDTDNNNNDPYSNGDNDMLAFELATEKFIEDILLGKIVVPIDYCLYNFENAEDNIYSGEQLIKGGYQEALIFALTGLKSSTIVSRDPDSQKDRNDLANKIKEMLEDAIENPDCNVITFSLRGGFEWNGINYAECIDGKMFDYDEEGAHAFAITNITADTVTFVNPWDTSTSYTMTWEEFSHLGIQAISRADLTQTTKFDSSIRDKNTSDYDMELEFEDYNTDNNGDWGYYIDANDLPDTNNIDYSNNENNNSNDENRVDNTTSNRGSSTGYDDTNSGFYDWMQGWIDYLNSDDGHGNPSGAMPSGGELIPEGQLKDYNIPIVGPSASIDMSAMTSMPSGLSSNSIKNIQYVGSSIEDAQISLDKWKTAILNEMAAVLKQIPQFIIKQFEIDGVIYNVKVENPQYTKYFEECQAKAEHLKNMKIPTPKKEDTKLEVSFGVPPHNWSCSINLNKKDKKS